MHDGAGGGRAAACDQGQFEGQVREGLLRARWCAVRRKPSPDAQAVAAT